MIRRRVVPLGPARASIYSLSRPGKEVKHLVSIDTQTGRVHCTCEAFKYTRGSLDATVSTPDLWCKHLLKVASWMVRKAKEAKAICG